MGEKIQRIESQVEATEQINLKLAEIKRELQFLVNNDVKYKSNAEKILQMIEELEKILISSETTS